MTQIDGHTQRRWTWSARGQGNRIFYALVAGWLLWLALAQPAAWIILIAAIAVYVVETAVILVLNYAGTDRQL